MDSHQASAVNREVMPSAQGFTSSSVSFIQLVHGAKPEVQANWVEKKTGTGTPAWLRIGKRTTNREFTCVMPDIQFHQKAVSISSWPPETQSFLAGGATISSNWADAYQSDFLFFLTKPTPAAFSLDSLMEDSATG